ncbi:hypothetical protein Hte_008973 [Hypoxylon texense]
MARVFVSNKRRCCQYYSTFQQYIDMARTVISGPQKRKMHLVRSHAHEEDIPGTVNVQAIEGDDAYHGQALFPVPAEDPNDPLQVGAPHTDPVSRRD